MKADVLLVAPNDGATSLYISEAFAELGRRVDLWDYRMLAQARNLPFMNYALEEKGKNYSLVLVLKGETIHERTLSRLSEATRTALWHFDSWQAREKWIVEKARNIQHFFTISKGLLSWYREQGVNAHWLTEGCSPVHHGRPVRDVNMYGGQKYVSEITFIGTVAGVNDRAEWLAEIGRKFGALKVWGSFPDQQIARFYRGRAQTDEDHTEICNRSKVNLDRSRTPEIEGSWSARVYRVMAAGGFLLANNVEGIKGYFKDGQELVVYEHDNMEDCLGKIAYYLEHPKERHAIASRGKLRALTVETFRHRLQELLKVVGL